MADGKAQARRKDGTRSRSALRREFSAGGIVWRRGATGSIEVAMVRPRGSKVWALPKGHIEQGESTRDAAVREVREEAGLKAGAVESLGDISYFFSVRERAGAPPARIFKRVRFFLMQFAGGDTARHDSEIDEAAWFSLEGALTRASYASERALLEKAGVILRERGVGV